MFRRWLQIVVLAGFVASATGLSLGLHEYTTHHDSSHSIHDCAVCQQLTSGSKAIVGDNSTPSLDNAVFHALVTLPAQLPLVRNHNEPISPRAPPLT